MWNLSFAQVSRQVYFLALLSLLVDIGGAFGVRYAFSVIIFGWAFLSVVTYGFRRDEIVEYGVLLYFLFSVCYALFRSVPLAEIYGQLSFLTYFVLLFVALHIPRHETEESFRRIMIIASVIVIATFFAILLVPASAVAWSAVGEKYRLGYLGLQAIGEQTFPNVYYRWSMWLIPALILSVGRFKVASLLIMVSVLITLSTSVIVFTMLGMGLVALVLRNQPNYNHRFVGYVAILMVAFLVFSESFYSMSGVLYENIVSKFSTSSGSTSVKLGHIEGIMQSLQTSIPNLIFGMGAGSEFYSPGVGGYVISVEVSHWNFVRQFGLLGGAIFFGYVVYVILSAYRTDTLGKRWSIGLLMLFAAAGTNPLLMSPVFMVVLVSARSYVARFYAEEVNE